MTYECMIEKIGTLDNDATMRGLDNGEIDVTIEGLDGFETKVGYAPFDI